MFETILILTVILTNTSIYFFLNDKERYKPIYLKISILLIIVSFVYYLFFKPENFYFEFLFILFFYSAGLIILHFMQIPLDFIMHQFVEKNKENIGLQKLSEFHKKIKTYAFLSLFPMATIFQIILILSTEIRLEIINQ